MSDQEKYVYVLKTVDGKRKAYEKFGYPKSGMVVAPDWDPKPEHGNGLHGALWGEGVSRAFDWRKTAKWLVLKVLESTIVDLDGKVKFPEAEVVFCGERIPAIEYLESMLGGHKPRWIVGQAVINGEKFYNFNRTIYLKTLPIPIDQIKTLSVGGNLNLQNKEVYALPESTNVAGHLDIRGTEVTNLSNDMHVGGYLNLEGSKVKALPEDLHVFSCLNLISTGINLPVTVHVSDSVYQ